MPEMPDKTYLNNQQQIVLDKLLEMRAATHAEGLQRILKHQQGTALEIWHAVLRDTVPEPYRGSLFAAHEQSKTFLKGSAVIFEDIGGGGFGSVKCAWDWGEKRDSAYKFYYPDALSGDEPDREYSILQKLQYSATGRSIAPAPLSRGVLDGGDHVEMSYHDSVSEENILHAWMKPALSYAVSSLADQAALVAIFHGSYGMAHQDLTPRNIILDARLGMRLLCDLHDATDENIVHAKKFMGLPDYLAPEKCNGNQPIDPKAADIFSFGVIAFKTLTGQLPSTMSSARDLMPERKNGISSAFIQLLRKSVPKDLFEFVMRMLHVRPEMRPTASECREFFLKWHIHLNRRHFPLHKRDDIKTPGDYERVLQPQEQGVPLSVAGSEDPLAHLRAEKGKVRIHSMQVSRSLKELYPDVDRKPEYSLPEASYGQQTVS